MKVAAIAALCLFGTTGVVLARGGAASTGSAVASAAAASQTGHAPASDDAGRHGGHHQRHRMAFAVLTVAARELGMTPKDLVAELKGGKSLAQVATAHGKTPAQVKSAILAHMREGLGKRVQEGAITQSQADAFLKRAESRVDTLMNKVWKAGSEKGPAVPGKSPGAVGT